MIKPYVYHPRPFGYPPLLGQINQTQPYIPIDELLPVIFLP